MRRTLTLTALLLGGLLPTPLIVRADTPLTIVRSTPLSGDPSRLRSRHHPSELPRWHRAQVAVVAQHGPPGE